MAKSCNYNVMRCMLTQKDFSHKLTLMCRYFIELHIPCKMTCFAIKIWFCPITIIKSTRPARSNHFNPIQVSRGPNRKSLVCMLVLHADFPLIDPWLSLAGVRVWTQPLCRVSLQMMSPKQDGSPLIWDGLASFLDTEKKIVHVYTCQWSGPNRQISVCHQVTTGHHGQITILQYWAS